MSKKDFTGGLDALVPEQADKPKRGRPRKDTVQNNAISQADKETRTTLILDIELMEKLKAIAYWDRLLIKEVVQDALEKAVTSYEKKTGGKVKPIPKR